MLTSRAQFEGVCASHNLRRTWSDKVSICVWKMTYDVAYHSHCGANKPPLWTKKLQRDTHMYMRNGSRVEEQRAMPWVGNTGVECRAEDAAVTISDSRMLWDLH